MKKVKEMREKVNHELKNALLTNINEGNDIPTAIEENAKKALKARFTFVCAARPILQPNSRICP